ncbi:MAG TPA: HEAT repeat domain-containing protein [Steroidobacteraceae bacterium]|nr:HEAT repeat domain-containing protein [Steroidobacteraceae bacterium]
MRSFYTVLLALLVIASGTTFAQKPTEQEELALAAMEGLMTQPADRALPIIRKVLAGSQTTLIKKRALFVLSQLDAPEAEDILLQTSRSPDAELRDEAIRSIGIGGYQKALAGLQQIYAAGDEDVKKQVLHAWMIAGRKQEVYQAALSARSEDEAGDAIHMLSVMGAVDELRKLGDRPNASGKLVEAYAISGDLASLHKIANGNSEKSVRTEAVRKIGIVGTDAARTALRDIYSRSTDREIKDAALEGMLIAGDEQGVLALYKAATTADEKRSLLRTLTMMDGDAALEAIDAALEGRK